ncbi:2-hydroxyacid dehydrogenase [Rhizobium sp. YIM 134829]|uniref:2-hydroxyacid dehydrogenase n=1 Tax=Rhizobium sp. YIM 134829 TaxID=3390453 RepID=UPI00397BA854
MIALITRLDRDEEEAWLAALTTAMPLESILPIAALTEEQRAAVEIAIVADPDPADLRQLPNLRWVQSLWAGVERLVGELQGFDRPIVRLVDPELARTMAEAVLAWTLYLSRDMPAYAAQQRAHLWQQRPYRPASALKVGLLGLGALGSASATLLQRVGFTVAGWSRSEKQVAGVTSHFGEDGLHTLLAGSDIVVCLLPLTAETTGLLDAKTFARMRRGAGFINFGRGRIVDTPALLAALDQGHLGHAVLDVFETEPLTTDSPLWDHPRVTVLPHISAPTTMKTAARVVAENIAGYRQSGRSPQSVDRARGY